MSELSAARALSRGFDRMLRDPVWGDVPLTKEFEGLFRSEAFQFLDGVRQLGPVALVYPGATHSRRSHSLGVYALARKLAISLSERGQLAQATETGLRSFLAAALCHDLGHFPYAHSLKELPLSPHEALGADIVESELSPLVEACGADPEAVASIMDKTRTIEPGSELQLYRRLLSGVLDPDKVDYLTRDAFFCGVPYGVQDADYIVRRILVSGQSPAIDEKGAMSVEAVLFSKYQMYRSVYWHPDVRAATAMVKKALLCGAEQGLLELESLYGLGDAGFAAIFPKTESWALPAREAFAGRLYRRVFELAFDPSNPSHEDMRDLARRSEAEASLAAAAGLAVEDVVIDLPEPIQFESDLPFIPSKGGTAPEPGALTGFFPGPEAAQALGSSLRRLRIFVRADTEKQALKNLAEELLA